MIILYAMLLLLIVNGNNEKFKQEPKNCKIKILIHFSNISNEIRNCSNNSFKISDFKFFGLKLHFLITIILI